MSPNKIDKIELIRPVEGRDQRLVGLSVGLTLFTPIPFRDYAPSIWALFDEYLQITPKELFTWQNLGGSSKAFKPITKSTFSTINAWLELRRSYGRICAIWLKDGETPTEVGDNLFNVFGKDTASSENDSSYLRIYFPHNIMDIIGSEQFLDKFHGMIQNVPFHSGYMGYVLNVSNLLAVAPYSSWIDQHSFAVAQRFPGIEIFKAHLENYEMKKFLRPPGWITFLSTPFIRELGGIDAIRISLGGDFVYRELQYGWSIQAGDRPRLGDRNRQEPVAPEQRLLARELARFYSEKPAFLFSKRPHEDSVAWIRRFLEE